MAGEDLHRLAVLADDARRDLRDALAYPVSWEDAKLAVGKFFDQDRRARRVAARLELTRDRDDVAVADAANLHDLHDLSIYSDIRSSREAAVSSSGSGSVSTRRYRDSASIEFARTGDQDLYGIRDADSAALVLKDVLVVYYEERRGEAVAALEALSLISGSSPSGIA